MFTIVYCAKAISSLLAHCSLPWSLLIYCLPCRLKSTWHLAEELSLYTYGLFFTTATPIWSFVCTDAINSRSLFFAPHSVILSIASIDCNIFRQEFLDSYENFLTTTVCMNRSTLYLCLPLHSDDNEKKYGYLEWSPCQHAHPYPLQCFSERIK